MSPGPNFYLGLGLRILILSIAKPRGNITNAFLFYVQEDYRFVPDKDLLATRG